MNAGADPGDRRDEPEGGEADGAGTPQLALEGFSGPLDHLLTLARAQKIDLSGISLAALVEQLATALRQAPATVPLSQKGDWVVMAAWLLQLRSRLLLPADAPARQDAAREAGQVRERLVALEKMQALAGWLERRPQLGQEVFARGRPEVLGVSVEAGQALDVVEFLWASLALFDDEPVPDVANVYRRRPLELYDVAEARDRILRRLTETPNGGPFERFLPDPPDDVESKEMSRRRLCSAWSSTLIASLELARQGNVVLGQEEPFTTIHISLSPGGKAEPVHDGSLNAADPACSDLVRPCGCHVSQL